jgi:hypothetical protein
VSCHQPLLPTGQSWELELSFLWTTFLLEVCQFQLTTSFSELTDVLFSPECGWAVLPSHKLDQLSLPSNPYQAEVKCSLCLFGYQFCPRGCAICPPTAQEQKVCHTHLVGLQFHSVESGELQDSIGRHQSNVLCS